jgi:ribonuclease P/MRP protein subunit RPP40
MMTCEPSETEHLQILTPAFSEIAQDLENKTEGELQDHLGSLLEWVAMVQINSPRVSGGDDVDPYLSRYSVPDNCEPLDLLSIKWRGFISSRWVMDLFLAVR